MIRQNYNDRVFSRFKNDIVILFKIFANFVRILLTLLLWVIVQVFYTKTHKTQNSL